MPAGQLTGEIKAHIMYAELTLAIFKYGINSSYCSRHTVES